MTRKPHQEPAGTPQPSPVSQATSTKRIAVFGSGRGSNLQAILDATAAGVLANCEVALVVSDRASSRVLARARDQDVAAVHVPVPRSGDEDRGARREAHERALLAALNEHGPIDLIVLAGYMRVLGPTFLDAWGARTVNIHPSLLPAFRGADAQALAIRAGVRIAGCTTHFVDLALDAGPIVLQAALPVPLGADRDTLASHLINLEHQVLLRTIDLVIKGRVERDGSRCTITPDASWLGRVERLPGVLYPDGF